MDVLEVLSASGVLQAVPRDALQTLAQHGKLRHFTAGEAVVQQGEHGETLHVILDGVVRVQRVQEVDPTLVTLAELDAGQVVGEMAVLSGTTRSATVVATEHTTTLEIDLEAFKGVASEYPILEVSLQRLALLREAANRGPGQPDSDPSV